MSNDKSQSANPRWFALINDTNITTPTRVVKASTLKVLAGIPTDQTLYRDHNSPEDEVLSDDEMVDLGEGNAFYSRVCPERTPPRKCSAPPKLAYSIDDRFELGVGELTGSSLLEIFSLPVTTPLLRDYESPNDQKIEAAQKVRFVEGPVFITRCEGDEEPFVVTIIVEGTPHRWTKKLITYDEVVKLEVPEYPQNPPIKYSVTYKGGPNNKPEGILPPGASVKVKDRMCFNVSETGQS